VVATVDSFGDAAEVIEIEQIDLIMTDISLAGEGDGIDVARAAAAKGVHVLFVTGNCTAEAQSLALGCLSKPYTERVLLNALEALDDHIQGKEPKKIPEQLTLFIRA
jgi:DNA-binding response OmpR family regulator